MKNNKLSRRLIPDCVMVFFYFPILYMLIFSFNGSRSLTSFDGSSLQWYHKMFNDRNMMEATCYTLVTVVVATFVSTTVGTITTIGPSKSYRIVWEVVQQINDFPVMNPEIVTAAGLMLLYVSLHIEKGSLTMLLAHTVFCTPYVILSVTPKLRGLDPNLAEVAMDLGARPTQVMWKVIVPQIMSGVVSDALITFTMSFDDFIISYFVTGNGVKDISTLVWTMSKRINPSISSLSTLIAIMVTIMLLIVNIVPLVREKAVRNNKSISYKVSGVVGTCFVLVIGGPLFALKGGAGSTSTEDVTVKYGSDTLKVYNRGEYMDPDVNTAFEKQYGVKVTYDAFDFNELTYTKLQGDESYDVFVLSDYMTEHLIKEEKLQPLDKGVVTNLAVLAGGVKGPSYNPDNTYSAPYFWDTVGIVYNKNNVTKADPERGGFNIFRNTKCKGRLYLYDSERDSFTMAFKALGYSTNTSSEKELYVAYEWLVKTVSTMDLGIVTDEVIDAMINGNKDLALVYSGDAASILSENEDTEYFTPKEGTNLWSDAMVTPKDAKNPKLANEYINFVLGYEQSMKNSLFVGYASSNGEVLDEPSGKDGEFYGNNVYMPCVGYPKDEIFEYNEKTKKLISDY